MSVPGEGEFEGVREHAEHGVRLFVQDDRGAHDVRLGSEPARPGSVAQQNEPLGALDRLRFREESARRGVVRSSGKRDGVTAAPNSVHAPSSFHARVD